MIWNDQTIQQLRDLWAEGHATAEIARRLGVSKNAVVGKAHRIGLDGRPSPIKRDELLVCAPKAKPVGVASTLPALPSVSAPVVTKAVPSKPVKIVGRTTPVETVAPVTAPATVFKPRRSTDCCWPIGEPGTKGFRYCDDVALPGKPYCAEHAKTAYVRTPVVQAVAT